MRIAILLPVVTISGGVKIALTYASEMQKRGHSVDVIVFSDIEYDGWMGVLDFPIHHFRRQEAMAIAMAGIDFDAVVCTFWKTVYIARAGLISARKHFYLIQGDEPNLYDDNSEEFLAARSTYSGPEHKIVISEYLQQRISSYEPSSRLDLIRNGINSSELLQSPFLNKSNKVRILVEGKLNDPIKRVDETLQILRNIDGIETIVVSPALDEMDLQLCDLLLRAVPAKKMGSIYASCDLIIKFSKTEGFGLPILEAMRCGVVPIVTDFGGVRDFLVDGVNGIIIDQLDVDQIHDSIQRAVANLDDLRENAISTASLFQWGNQFSQFAELLDCLPENGSIVSADTIKLGLTAPADNYYSLHSTFAHLLRRLGLTRRLSVEISQNLLRDDGTIDVNIGSVDCKIDLRTAISSSPTNEGRIRFIIDIEELGPIKHDFPPEEFQIIQDHGLVKFKNMHNFNKIFVEAGGRYTVRVSGRPVTGEVLYEDMQNGAECEFDYSDQNVRIIFRRS
jgi:glycosyltransferase involved in cell wall biosynthesis